MRHSGNSQQSEHYAPVLLFDGWSCVYLLIDISLSQKSLAKQPMLSSTLHSSLTWLSAEVGGNNIFWRYEYKVSGFHLDTAGRDFLWLTVIHYINTMHIPVQT